MDEKQVGLFGGATRLAGRQVRKDVCLSADSAGSSKEYLQKEAVRTALDEAIAIAGGSLSSLANELVKAGIPTTRQIASRWYRDGYVPIGKAVAIARLTGIEISRLNPALQGIHRLPRKLF
jgi:hypothetical protein